MAVNHKPTGRAASMPAGLLQGALVSIAVTLSIAAILAKLLDSEKIGWENIGYGIVFLLLAASFLGAIAAYRKIKRQRILVCAASGVIYFGVLLAVTALFFGGQYHGILVTFVLIFAGSVTAGLLGLGHGGSKGMARKNRIVKLYKKSTVGK